VLLVLALAWSASPARADGTPRIFPLVVSAPLAPELTDAPTALTDALAELLDGVTTDRSLDEFGKKLRCDVEMTPCLDAVARALVTSRLVYGTVVSTTGGKIKVKLVRFDSAKEGSEMHQRTFTLTAKTPRRLGKQLARSAAKMFDRAPPEEAVQPAPSEDRDPTPSETIVVPDEEQGTATGLTGPTPAEAPARGGITGGTWALLGGGALGVAVGAGLVVSARGLAEDAAAAPRATVDDFRRLTEIERAGKLRTQVGGVLLVAGGASLAVGVVRAYMQRGGGQKTESLERSIALVPVEGGAAVVFSGGLR
jgi:hypothetical protein